MPSIVTFTHDPDVGSNYIPPTSGSQVMSNQQYTFLYLTTCGTPVEGGDPTNLDPSLPATPTYGTGQNNAKRFSSSLPTNWPSGDHVGATPPIEQMMDMTQPGIQVNTLYKRNQVNPSPTVIKVGWSYSMDPTLTCAPGKQVYFKVYKLCGDGVSTIDQLLSTATGKFSRP